MQYKIKIANRQYSEFTVYDNILLRPIELKLNPVSHKLFDQDVFEVSEEKIDIIHSTIRSVKNIPNIAITVGSRSWFTSLRPIFWAKGIKSIFSTWDIVFFTPDYLAAKEAKIFFSVSFERAKNASIESKSSSLRKSISVARPLRTITFGNSSASLSQWAKSSQINLIL